MKTHDQTPFEREDEELLATLFNPTTDFNVSRKTVVTKGLAALAREVGTTGNTVWIVEFLEEDLSRVMSELESYAGLRV